VLAGTAYGIGAENCWLSVTRAAELMTNSARANEPVQESLEKEPAR